MLHFSLIKKSLDINNANSIHVDKIDELVWCKKVIKMLDIWFIYLSHL